MGKREPWKLATFVPVSALWELDFPLLSLRDLLHVIFCLLKIDALFAVRTPCACLRSG